MALSKPVKVLVAAATCWPILYFFIFMGFMIFQVFLGGMRPSHGASGPPRPFMIIFALHFLTILWIFGLLAFYLTYLFKTDRIGQDKKALWAVVLFMGNMIAMPIFFVVYVWPDPPRKTELPSAASSL
jgi:hypothetical protein